MPRTAKAKTAAPAPPRPPLRPPASAPASFCAIDRRRKSAPRRRSGRRARCTKWKRASKRKKKPAPRRGGRAPQEGTRPRPEKRSRGRGSQGRRRTGEEAGGRRSLGAGWKRKRAGRRQGAGGSNSPRRVVAEGEEETVSKKGAKAPAKAPAARRERTIAGAANSPSPKGAVGRRRAHAFGRLLSRHLQRVNKGQQAAARGPVGPARSDDFPKLSPWRNSPNRMARRSVDVIKVLMKTA